MDEKDFEIVDEITSCVEVLEVLEEPEENLMLVACGCTQRTQRADQQIC